MTDTNKTDLTPERLVEMHERLRSLPESPDSGYKSLDHAMRVLAKCVHPYTGEQAHAVAAALREWHTKWAAAVDLLPAQHALRDAFDAGARAMHDAMVQRIEGQEHAWVWEGDHPVVNITTDVQVEIAKLPGRPGNP